jgi:hypothetical protein
LDETSGALADVPSPSGEANSRSEFAIVVVEGELRSTVDLAPSSYCTSASVRFSLSPEQVAAFASDGDIDVLVENSVDLAPSYYCPSSHALRLDYTTSIDPLDFGMVLLGASRTLGARVRNAGTTDLTVSSIGATHAAFTAGATTLRIAPGASQQVDVTFRPTVAGQAQVLRRQRRPGQPVFDVDLASGQTLRSACRRHRSGSLLSGEHGVQTLEPHSGGSPP